MIRHLPYMNEAVHQKAEGTYCASDFIRAKAYRENFGKSSLWARSMAEKAWLENFPTYIYEYDLVAGSRRGNFVADPDERELAGAQKLCGECYGSLRFGTNNDHYAPAYQRFLQDGICGTMDKIHASQKVHKGDPEKTEFLLAMEEVLRGFSTFVSNHSKAAAKAASETKNPDCAKELQRMAEDLAYVAWEAPVTLRQALHLVSLIHLTFCMQHKYAMALGRADQYLYPFYKHDIEAGILTNEEAEDLFACFFIKIDERRLHAWDDVVNICIGGVTPAGEEGINELSYIILHAVRDCNIPGPNLSARLHEGMPDRFLDECLQVIGTGIGYPALMNDRANIPALLRHGYTLEDARDHCFVGCIENFIPGKQPAWTDGRFNVPHCLESVFHNGRSMVEENFFGLSCDLSSLDSMDAFMREFERQIAYSAGEYVTWFNCANDNVNYKNRQNVFMSMLCDDCIGRGMDINCGGALYPSVHGACGMGIGTIADSLAAIEKVVFQDKVCTLEQLRDALAVNFEGQEVLRQKLLNAPKYGNNDDFVDKYAVWYVQYLEQIFSQYHTRDGGDFYVLIASNTNSISAGNITGATPDGRKATVPLSDAASPTYGVDQNGPTSSFLSLCKPDYSLAAGGTVVNQKYTPDMLQDPVKRSALLAAIQVYFENGGQEVQINCVSKKTLMDAMEHPENYQGMVVRVSGFSARFTELNRGVQEDIIHRTEHSHV